jgi:hypothetical protein
MLLDGRDILNIWCFFTRSTNKYRLFSGFSSAYGGNPFFCDDIYSGEGNRDVNSCESGGDCDESVVCDSGCDESVVNSCESADCDEFVVNSCESGGDCGVEGVDNVLESWVLRVVMAVVFFFSSLFIMRLEGVGVYGLKAQSTYHQFEKGERLQKWNYQRSASYQEARQVFVSVYGTDSERWPLFVRRAMELNREYRAYENERRQPGHTFYLNFLVEKDKGLD